ncbi:MAG: hypothetical protein HY848_04315 [Betaproteobacteria bacterium]|nr:hypothetical protein [Betaproteobacteria bacterium]
MSAAVAAIEARIYSLNLDDKTEPIRILIAENNGRVIYYFFNEEMPLYLITLFAKNQQDNLTKTERKELDNLVETLIDVWRKD